MVGQAYFLRLGHLNKSNIYQDKADETLKIESDDEVHDRGEFLNLSKSFDLSPV